MDSRCKERTGKVWRSSGRSQETQPFDPRWAMESGGGSGRGGVDVREHDNGRQEGGVRRDTETNRGEQKWAR